MNKQQRAKLAKAKGYIEEALSIISVTKDQEDDKLNNIPENLQSGERYEAIENAINELEDAIQSLEQASENINNARSF